MTEVKSYDYVVVGGGTAGCVIAARLSEDPRCSVCLIEAGGSDASPWITIPMLYFIANSQSKLQWGFKTQPEGELLGRQLGLTQAKVIGGASSINGMIYTRGFGPEYDRWGVPEWSFNSLLPYFERSAPTHRGNRAEPGARGPIQLTQAKGDLPISEAFLNATEAEGYPTVPDLNADVAHGFGYVHYTIDRGRRSSAASAYLTPAKRRPNLHLYMQTLVSRIVVEKQRATGIECHGPNGAMVIRSNREVILSAGAINSPKILMLSGMGPASHLAAHAIEVQLDQPQIGRNLSNHLRYGLRYETSAPVTAYRYYHPWTSAIGGLNYLLRRRGFLAGTALPISGVIRTDPASDLPTIKASISTALLGGGPSILDMMPKAHGFSVLVYGCSPFSRGEVRLASADFRDAPAIASNYLSDSRDLPILLDGIERMRAIVARPALARLVKREIQPGNAIASRSSLVEEIRKTANNVYHAVGTCRLGEDVYSVVDPQLRVRGINGLRVADMSVIPSLIGSGTYALALMIGEKAAALISQTPS